MAQGTCSVKGCTRTRHARGWCKAHYLRWRRYGDPDALPEREMTCRQCETTWTWVAKSGNHKPMLCPACLTTHKFCHKCHQSRPLSEWHINRESDAGKIVQCKWCRAREPKQYTCGNCETEFYRTDRGGRQATTHLCDRCETAYKWCSRCDSIKRHSAFSIAQDKRTHLVSHCRMCQSVAYSRLTGSARRKRVLSKYGLTLEQWAVLHDQQGGCCAICGQAPANGRWHILHIDHDHRTGRIRGLLCHNCNLGIGNFQDNADMLECAARYLRSRSGVVEVI